MRWDMFERLSSCKRWILMLAFGLMLANAAWAQAPDAAQILAASDKARGGGLPGITWQVDVTTQGSSRRSDDMSLVVKSNGDDNLMVIVSPAKARGRKILMRGNNMWFSTPNVRKPVPISPRQRLTGQASYGDVAATNYVEDYTATLSGTETVDQKPCYVLDLSAANGSVTYDKIRYWVAQDSGLGVKADFYTISGKLLKTATFEYNNAISYDGKTIPFVSQMRITDTLAGDTVTTLTYSSIETRALSARDFQLN